MFNKILQFFINKSNIYLGEHIADRVDLNSRLKRAGFGGL